jgi:hypothetical protein
MKYIDLIFTAYLVTIGIYMSAISLSQDAELRRSTKRVARLQSKSKLFDSMVIAEIEKKIEKRVMQIIRTQSFEMEKEAGMQPSLSDQEI